MKLPRKANLLYIFQTGYSLANYPIGIFTTLTTIYYLAINNLPLLKAIFPQFWMFLAAAGVIGLPVILVVGQGFIKSPLNKASTRTHPYSTLLIPTQFPMYAAQAKLCRLHGLDVEALELETLIRRSREEW